MKIGDIIEHFFGRKNLAEKWKIRSLFLPSEKLTFLKLQPSTFCIGSAPIINNFRNDQNPQINSAFIITLMFSNFICVEFNDAPDCFVQVEQKRGALD